MRLGLRVPQIGATTTVDEHAIINVAEGLGYESIWTSESYGSDAIVPLAWWGSGTRMRLGTDIASISARTPAATAMTAMTLDWLSRGRAIVGLGVSGPRVVEEWHGQPFAQPIARMREYVEIVRKIVARREPVTLDGRFYHRPRDARSAEAHPLKSILHPVRSAIPIYIAAGGPKNVALAAEIGDGWLASFFAPSMDTTYREWLGNGFRNRQDSEPSGFEVVAHVNVVFDDDVGRAAEQVKPTIAFYVGAMGRGSENFYYQAFCRMGYVKECEQIHELYGAGRRSDAIAAVSDAMVEEVALVGPPGKVREDLERYKTSVLSTLLVFGDVQTLTKIASFVLQE